MAINEALVLDGLALNDGTVLSLEAFDIAPAPAIEEWIKGADSDGALLGREPLFDNVVRDLRIRVEPQASMDLALAKVALLVDKLQEAARNANGLALTWVPATSTLPTLTARCLAGQITNLPVDWENGWLGFAPTLTVKLTCLPFWEGTETLIASVTSSEPLVALELTGIAGDIAALGRLVVTDAAAQSRQYVRWGLESRWYPTSSPPSLIVDSSGMVTSGYAGATSTRSGAYNGASNNVIRATLQPQHQAICGLGNLTHIGAFRPQLRFYTTAATVAVRLVYQTLDGPFRSLSYVLPASVGWNHVDLGLITIPAAALGLQRWTGRIEAYSLAAGGETFDVDAAWLLPAEQTGRARAPYAYSPGLLVARDAFTAMIAGVALNARVAPQGGTWVTSGAAGDFLAVDGPTATEESISRATVSDAGGRIAQLGATTYGDIEIGLDVRFTTPASGSLQSTVARVTNSLNYVQLSLVYAQGYYLLNLQIIVAGSVVQTVERILSLRPGVWYRLRLVVYAASGTAHGALMEGTAQLAASDVKHAALATGGAVASGIAQFFDVNATATATTRWYENYYVATPAAEPVVINASRSIEFRHDGALRKDATGTYAGRPPEYVGPRLTIPPAGGPARKARVAVLARRADILNAADDYIADSTTVAVYATFRYLAVPR